MGTHSSEAQMVTGLEAPIVFYNTLFLFSLCVLMGKSGEVKAQRRKTAIILRQISKSLLGLCGSQEKIYVGVY